MRFTVFYGNQIYGEWESWEILRPLMKEMPDGVYLLEIHEINKRMGYTGWYNKDLTPVLEADVPPYLKHLQLVLSL